MTKTDLSRRQILAASGGVAVAAAATSQIARAAAPKGAGRIGKIAMEEHFMFPEFVDYLAETRQNIRPELYSKVVPILEDFGERRLTMMDNSGVEYSILSLAGPGVQVEKDTARATRMARLCNDKLAVEIQKAPKRYGGFAHLALQDPVEAGRELERCMKELGFQGALINGETCGIYMDDRRFDPFFEKAEALGAAIYLHPGNPPRLTHGYEEHPELWGPTWSWAAETCTHFLRLVFGGVFDRFPGLRFILGHMGETLPIQPWRLDSRYPISNQRGAIKLRPSEYLRRNLWITTSGVCDDVALRCSLDNIGPDKVMFSIDYPFEHSVQAGQWMDTAKVREAERFAVARGNAMKLLPIPALA